jgi:hypothetical protein
VPNSAISITLHQTTKDKVKTKFWTSDIVWTDNCASLRMQMGSGGGREGCFEHGWERELSVQQEELGEGVEMGFVG